MSDATGRCLCGAVRFAVPGPMRPVIFCHCEQCRRTSGHHVAATACSIDAIDVTDDGSLTWYRSSESAERGFCGRCGSNLFYRPGHRQWLSIMAGTLDLPTGLDAAAHIFVDSKSDYYTIGDGLPQLVDRGDVDLTAGRP
jgi:hypothetical protein